MKFYKYQSLETAEQTIERIEEYLQCPYLWASSPKSFNDPFELKVALEWPEEMEDAREKYFTDNPQYAETEFVSWWNGLDKRFKNHIAMEARAGIMANHGVCCLSSKPDNALLWSHYSESHTGFCVEYDFPDDDTNILFQIQDFVAFRKVIYSESKNTHNHFTDSDNELVERTFFNKSSDWEYEDEFRVIFSSSGRKELPANSISKIILGCRTNSSIHSHIWKLMKSTEVKFSQMVENPFEFALIEKEVKEGVTYTSSFF